jgi:hypothetical protein
VSESNKHLSLLQRGTVRSLVIERSTVGGHHSCRLTLPTNVEGLEVTESDKHSSLLQCESVRSLPIERKPIGGTTNVGYTLPTNVACGGD